MTDLFFYLQTAFLLCVFFLGAIIGSFLNVCIARIPYGFSIVYPPSRCPACMGRIAPWDNVPVLAWLWLRGRCRKCRMPISFQYPLVELLFGLCALGLYFRWNINFALPYYAYFAGSMIVLALIDWRHYILPDSLTLTGGIVGLAFSHWMPGTSLLSSAAGAALGAACMAAMYYGYYWWRGVEGLGQGDIKLMFFIGAFLGPAGMLWSALLGSLLALALALALALRKRASWGTALPYGTFLCSGALVYLFWGKALVTAYWRFFGLEAGLS